MMMGKLAAAVCAVMSEVGHVQKTGHNSFSRYSYASDADLLRALQPSMAKHGLMMHPVRVERSDSTRKNAKGKEEDRCDLLVTYILTHTSGESIEIQSPGTGMDSLDKAPYKAMTGAYKYALRQLFAVPTGNDAEAPRKPEPPPVFHKQRGVTTSPEWRTFEAALAEHGIDRDDFRDWFEREYGRRPDTLPRDGLRKLTSELPKLKGRM